MRARESSALCHVTTGASHCTCSRFLDQAEGSHRPSDSRYIHTPKQPSKFAQSPSTQRWLHTNQESRQRPAKARQSGGKARAPWLALDTQWIPKISPRVLPVYTDHEQALRAESVYKQTSNRWLPKGAINHTTHTHNTVPMILSTAITQECMHRFLIKPS